MVEAWTSAQDGVKKRELRESTKMDFIRNIIRRFNKRNSELAYWATVNNREGRLANEHYEYFYTSHFGLSREFYANRRILDIGCGPRGSLEWADAAAERIGLDPLVKRYRRLGIGRHCMRYVAARSERIPFPDDYFDVVCSFNSLDHVDDLDQTIREISRVAKKGGLFLLLTDVNHQPTPCEPLSFSWDIREKFLPVFRIIEEKRFEKSGGLYESIKAGVPYLLSNRSERYGVLSVKFEKNS